TSMEGLAIVYGACLMLVAAQMGLLPDRYVLRRDMPVGWARRIIGTGIGLLSAMMGVGGGSLGGMTMTLCGRPIHQAVATASGFGVAIGATAALGFMAFGWGAEGRPPLSLGYVNLPAAVVMGVMTALSAPLGARLAHRLDQRLLKKAFAVYLLGTAASVVLKAI
ncbi:sulfite exporter TauE/SafE family protein, partial [uncultured Brevundimonas sp.]